MNLKKIIGIFYLGYSIYAMLVINTTSISFYTMLPAILFMWSNYIFFSIGYKMYQNKSIIHVYEYKKEMGWLVNKSKLLRILIAILSLLFSILAVRYYTGQTPSSVVRSFINNISVYYEYQNFFKNQNLNVFTLTKIPYILMLFYTKFIVFFSYIG